MSKNNQENHLLTFLLGTSFSPAGLLIASKVKTIELIKIISRSTVNIALFLLFITSIITDESTPNVKEANQSRIFEVTHSSYTLRESNRDKKIMNSPHFHPFNIRALRPPSLCVSIIGKVSKPDHQRQNNGVQREREGELNQGFDEFHREAAEVLSGDELFAFSEPIKIRVPNSSRFQN